MAQEVDSFICGFLRRLYRGGCIVKGFCFIDIEEKLTHGEGYVRIMSKILLRTEENINLNIRNRRGVSKAYMEA